MTFRLGTLAMLIFGLLAACESSPDQTLEQPAVDIPFTKHGELTFSRPDGSEIVTVDIEIADTDSLRERGMMQRTGMPENSGMLFIFDQQAPRSFWMANTPLSLDMIFVDRDREIVNIAKYVKPQSSTSTSSTAPAQFVVEMLAGFSDSWGLTDADRVSWTRTDGR